MKNEFGVISMSDELVGPRLAMREPPCIADSLTDSGTPAPQAPLRRLGMTAQAVAAVFLIALLAGCSNASSKADLSWVEPVKLASGAEISIRRHVVMRHTRALGGGFSSAPVYQTSSVELLSDNEAFAKWDATFVPLLLDKDPLTNEWVLVAGADECSPWLRNGRPRPPYWAFRFRGGAWLRDAIPASFLSRPSNLFVEMDVDDDSEALAKEIRVRKATQASQPKHAPQYSRIDPTFGGFERCGRDRPSGAIGVDELDLKAFGSVK